MLKTFRSAAKKTKIIAFSRLFLGSKCARLELVLLFIVSKVFKHRRWRLMLNWVQHVV